MRQKPYILKSDVSDLSGKLLAKAGQEITPIFLKELAKKKPSSSKPKLIAKYPELLDDYREFCKTAPYNRIFSDEKSRKDVCDLLSRAKLFPEVYESLQYFKDKNIYTYQHILMVSALSTKMANDTTTLYRHALDAATVTPAHDIGKINIPLELLAKSDKLTKTEIDTLREHTVSGLVLLTYHIGEEDPLSCQVAFEHHELMDGTGYPRKFKQASELVQLVTVCDIFDALVVARPYRKQNYTLRGALEVIMQAALEKKLNMNFVKLLIAYNRSGKLSLDPIILSQQIRETEPLGNQYSIKHIRALGKRKNFILPDND